MKQTLLRLLLACSLIVTILATSCTKDTEPADMDTATETTEATYRPADSLFTKPEGYQVESYYLTVPENRSKPEEGTIDIYFSIYRSESVTPEPDPIVYLAGGPGEHANESSALMFEQRFAPLLKNHDLIIVDQRGTGYSIPALDCNALIDLYYENLDGSQDPEEASSAQLEAIKEYHDQLVSDGTDLTAYNSAENAADLNDLRIALGYKEWNLLGVSYGTRLALTMLRDYPEGIRSVILCSSYPLQADLYTETAKNIHRALNTLFEANAADPESSREYPDIETTLYTTAARLNESPVHVQVMHQLTGEVYDVLLDGYGLIDTIITSLYSTDILPLLPKMIYDAAEGKYDTLALLLGSDMVNMEMVSIGMYYSVQFNEELPFVTYEEIVATVDDYPELQDFFEYNFTTSGQIFTIYDFWDAGTPDPDENEPVHSNVPTLVFAGEFDPITPPEWGELAAETLENSYYYKLTGTGHDTIFSPHDCVMEMALEFINDPNQAPDSACTKELEQPDFITMDIDLVPFTSTMYGFKGVYPDGWEEIAPGAYQLTDLGITALIEQAAPNVGKDLMISVLASTVGIEGDMEPVDEFTSNGLEWSVYQTEMQSLATDFALAEQDGTCYFVLFSCVPDDHQFYYEELVVPAVKAMELLL